MVAMSGRLGLISLVLGIGLFVFNCLAWALFFVGVIAVGPGTGNRELGDAVLTGLGLLGFVTVIGYIVGLVLGIVALARGEPRRTAAVLGTVINALLLLGVAMLAGLAALGISA